MSALKSGIAQLGTQALPLTLGATGGATDVGTWTHAQGKKALSVELFDSVNGAKILDASVVITQPDANSIVFTNTTAGILAGVAIVTWEVWSGAKSGEIPAADVVLA